MANAQLNPAARKLNEAKIAFNVAQLALTSALKPLRAGDEATGKLLDLAEEYGVDHAMKQLGKTPEKLDVHGPLTADALSNVKNTLEAAHEASQKLDLAMAAHEEIAIKLNPQHRKAIIFDGRETLYNPNDKTLTDRNTHDVAAAKVRTVEPTDYDKDSDRH